MKKLLIIIFWPVLLISCTNKEINNVPIVINKSADSLLQIPTSFNDVEIIDSILANCIDKNGSTYGMNACTVEAIDLWKTEMYKYYVLLENNLDSTAKDKLKFSQKEWLKYYDSQVEFCNSFYGEMNGTMWTTVNLGCRLEIIKHRAIELRSDYNIFLLYGDEKTI